MIRNKFIRDVVWNTLSTLVLSVAAILINVLIGNMLGATDLGIFHQVLAWYMIFSILCAGGIHNSVLKYSSEFHNRPDMCSVLLSQGLLMVIIFSLAITAIIKVSFTVFPPILDVQVQKGIHIAATALPFFSANKVLMAYMNGLRRMKMFAFIQSCRWLLMLLFISGILYSDQNPHMIYYSFLFTECLLFLVLLIDTRRHAQLGFNFSKEWFTRHLSFGSRTIFATSLAEFNSRVDIIILGFFLPHAQIGIYGFSVNVARGFVMLGSIIQLNFNPIMSYLWAEEQLDKLRNTIRRIRQSVMRVIAPLVILFALFYPFFIRFVMTNPVYEKSIPVFLILLAGIGTSTIVSWSNNMLNMAGYPQITMLLNFITLVLNVVILVISTFYFGLIGAAIGTAFFFIIKNGLMVIFINRVLCIRIL